MTGNQEVGIQYKEAMADDPMRRRPDCSLARRVLNWTPKVDFSDGLDYTIAWHMQKMSV
jgi:nucleoside-diphosphate-sugar epimerase